MQIVIMKREERAITPENLPFLKMKFINFFLIPMDQKYQNESAPIFCYAKITKTA